MVGFNWGNPSMCKMVCEVGVVAVCGGLGRILYDTRVIEDGLSGGLSGVRCGGVEVGGRLQGVVF